MNLTPETIAATLLTHGTVTETAKVLKVNRSTIYKHMRDPEFKELYIYGQADVFSQALKKCIENITGAIDTIAAIMKDTKVNPQTRLQAAQTILNKSVSLYEVSDGLKDKAYKSNRDLSEIMQDNLFEL